MSHVLLYYNIVRHKRQFHRHRIHVQCYKLLLHEWWLETCIILSGGLHHEVLHAFWQFTSLPPCNTKKVSCSPHAQLWVHVGQYVCMTDVLTGKRSNCHTKQRRNGQEGLLSDTWLNFLYMPPLWYRSASPYETVTSHTPGDPEYTVKKGNTVSGGSTVFSSMRQQSRNTQPWDCAWWEASIKTQTCMSDIMISCWCEGLCRLDYAHVGHYTWCLQYVTHPVVHVPCSSPKCTFRLARFKWMM